jgi:hypothetical protein
MGVHNSARLDRFERKAPALAEGRGFSYDPVNERYVIGGIFNSDDPIHAFHTASRLLAAPDFSESDTRLVYLAIQELATEGLPINEPSLKNKLIAKGQMDRVGSLLIALRTGDLPKIHCLEGVCNAVAGRARRCWLFNQLDSIQVRLLNGADPLERITSDAMRALSTHQLTEAIFAPVRSKPPEKIGTAALYGLPGEVLRLMMPHTESGEAALLVQFLVATGIFIGRTGYYLAEGDRHYTNLFAALVGGTSTGRKGTSWSRVRQLYEVTDEEFIGKRRKSGMASGEGLKKQHAAAIKRPASSDL